MADETHLVPLPETFDPRTIEEHGITIPVPTPTWMVAPNPWATAQGGNGASPTAAAGTPPATGDVGPASSERSD